MVTRPRDERYEAKDPHVTAKDIHTVLGGEHDSSGETR